jgi:predicted Zn-dependent protease
MEPEFRRALQINPNNATAHYFYAFEFLVPENRLQEALAEFRTALSLDPLSTVVNMNYGITLVIARQSTQGLEQLRQVEERDPSFRGIHFYEGEFHAISGDFAEAEKDIATAARIPDSWSPDALGYLKLTTALAEQDNAWVHPALAALLAHEPDKVFPFLERGYAAEDPDLDFVIRYPAFDPIRSDPQYAPFMRKLGLPQ